MLKMLNGDVVSGLPMAVRKSSGVFVLGREAGKEV
jgi:hypothetical protein